MLDTPQDLFEELFSEVGEIKSIYFPEDRSYAHITYENPAHAFVAQEKFDRAELDFMEIRVEFAKDTVASNDNDDDKFGPTPYKPKRRPRPKGSRKGLRGRKRS